MFAERGETRSKSICQNSKRPNKLVARNISAQLAPAHNRVSSGHDDCLISSRPVKILFTCICWIIVIVFNYNEHVLCCPKSEHDSCRQRVRAEGRVLHISVVMAIKSRAIHGRRNEKITLIHKTARRGHFQKGICKSSSFEIANKIIKIRSVIIRKWFIQNWYRVNTVIVLESTGWNRLKVIS